MLVRHFRIDAHHFWMIQSGNESEICSRAGHINIATRFVRLGFEREFESILLIKVVFAKVVDGFAEVLDGVIRTTAGVGFSAFAPSPEDENLCSEFRAQIHCTHGLLHRVGAHIGIIGCEGTIAKNRIVEQVHSGHRHNHSMSLAGGLEFANDAVALGGCGVDGNEVVVVEVHTPGADLSEQCYDVVGWNRRTYCFAERITAAVSDGPQPKREFVFRLRIIIATRHESP